MFERSRKTVVAHVDLDAFYTQVEVQRNPSLAGQPVVVIQYSPAAVSLQDMQTLRPSDQREMPASNGAIIAVSYEARGQGVKRFMHAQEAKAVCPNLHIIQVPVSHGKSDLTIYREAGAQVAAILARVCNCERASIDEVYLDLTEEATRRLQQQQQEQLRFGIDDPIAPLPPDTFEGIHLAGLEDAASWWSRPADEWDPHERMLAVGAAIVVELRAAVRRELGYSCSAGVAHYKLLAKLGSGLHKPAQQTVVPAAFVPALLHDLPVPRLRQLGGKFGEELMRSLNVTTVGELASVPLARLNALYDQNTAMWLARLAQGIDSEEVKARLLPKSISCGKSFRFNQAIRDAATLQSWMMELAQEVAERVAADHATYGRMATSLTVNFSQSDPAASVHSLSAGSVARSCPLRRTTAEAMAEDALALVKKVVNTRSSWRVTSLTLGVSNFIDAVAGVSSITRFFKPSGLLVGAQTADHDNTALATPVGPAPTTRADGFVVPHATDPAAAPLAEPHAWAPVPTSTTAQPADPLLIKPSDRSAMQPSNTAAQAVDGGACAALTELPCHRAGASKNMANGVAVSGFVMAQEGARGGTAWLAVAGSSVGNGAGAHQAGGRTDSCCGVVDGTRATRDAGSTGGRAATWDGVVAGRHLDDDYEPASVAAYDSVDDVAGAAFDMVIESATGVALEVVGGVTSVQPATSTPAGACSSRRDVTAAGGCATSAVSPAACHMCGITAPHHRCRAPSAAALSHDDPTAVCRAAPVESGDAGNASTIAAPAALYGISAEAGHAAAVGREAHAAAPAAAAAGRHAGGLKPSRAGGSAQPAGRPAAGGASDAHWQAVQWSEVDLAVLAELPWDVQQELRRGMGHGSAAPRPAQQPNSRQGKRPKKDGGQQDISSFLSGPRRGG